MNSTLGGRGRSPERSESKTSGSRRSRSRGRGGREDSGDKPDSDVTSSSDKFIVFYSNSKGTVNDIDITHGHDIFLHIIEKDFKIKDLSTMYRCNVSMVVEGEFLVFPSVEHAFQGIKFMYSNSTHGIDDTASRLKLVKLFSYGGEYGRDVEPKKVKRLGGKAHMRSLGRVLDIDAWNKERDAIMKKLIKSRADTDYNFKDCLRNFHKLNIKMLHFERSGPKSYWGGHFPKSSERVLGNWKGNNKLGKIMMEVASEMSVSTA